MLGLPAVWTTYANADEGNHAPNENMTIDAFLSGICASAVVLHRFADMSREELSQRGATRRES